VIHQTLLLLPLVFSQAEVAPNTMDIASALNDGVELGYNEPTVFSVANVRSLKGGKTIRGDYLFTGKAEQVWLHDRDEALKIISEELEKENFITKSFAAIAIQKLPEFKKGDKHKDLRFRIRLERAGTDWIATSSTILSPDGVIGP
jgi:hypothetical protein